MTPFVEPVQAADPDTQRIVWGPWKGSMRSTSAEQVPREYIAAGSDFLYLPRSGTWKRRNGQTIKFDTFLAQTGLLPALWASSPTSSSAPGKGRQLEEFLSDSVSDGVPTLIGLITRETVSSGLDDGRFSNVYIRDQVNSLNYILGEEWNTTTYPSPGSTQTHRFVPLWYASGDGGITRGIDEYQRRLFFMGSRTMRKVQRWWYFPSYLGTPSRWEGGFTDPSSLQLLPTSDAAADTFTWQQIGAATWWQCINTADDATTYASRTEANGTWNFHVIVSGGTVPTSGQNVVVNYRARRTGALAVDTTISVNFVGTDGVQWSSATITPQTAWTTSFADYTLTCSTSGASGQTAARLGFTAICNSSGGLRMDVTYAYIGGSGTSFNVARLCPSGPWPPTHPGTVAAGTLTASNETYGRPDSDVSTGGWTDQSGGTTNIYTTIDEATIDELDYIKTPTDTNNYVSYFTTGDLGVTPSVDDSVVLRARIAHTGSGIGSLTLQVREGTNPPFADAVFGRTGTTSAENVTVTLSPAEIASVTDWTNIQIGFFKQHISGAADAFQVYYATIVLTGDQNSLGGWSGSDQFYYAVAYRWEDGSLWQPTTPRGPNANLGTGGFGLFTVNSSNPSGKYQSITYSNLPIGPPGTIGRQIYRSPKIDSSVQSVLSLNANDLRLVWEIKDNTTTTYEDFFADDDSLGLDSAGLIIRLDQAMPPAARYNFAGNSRVGHSYTRLNPTAIELAPVGASASYDRNVADSSSTAYSVSAFYYQISSTALKLVKDDGVTPTTSTFLFSTYTTLEDLIDGINATTTASSGGQWRAQLAPGANSRAATTNLCPTTRSLTTISTTSGSPLITRASGMSAIPVGAFVTGTGIPGGTYVVRIDSDLQLRLSANATATSGGSPVTLTFNANTGDAITGGTSSANGGDGYVRAFCNALPSWLYFTNTYLNLTPAEKSAVWLTVATPGSVKSAANSFTTNTETRHTPPQESGISMGGVAVGNGFVVPMSRKRCVIRNPRDNGTGIDSDFHLYVTNESSGCTAWQSLTAGTQCAFMWTPQGWIAADLESENWLSPLIYQDRPNNLTSAVTSIGDFGYEAAACEAAAGADTDGAYMIARVMRNALWVNYRNSSSDTRPSRQVVYDFSNGAGAGDIRATMRAPGEPWGWSTPLVRAFTAMAEARRSDGAHLYGWNDANAGSTGDGRIDEFEVTNQDNAVDFSASISTPWERVSTRKLVSFQELIIEHASPNGATISLTFVRGNFEASPTDTYALSLSTSSNIVLREVLPLPTTGARCATPAGYVTFAQTAGGAAELRAVEAEVYRLRSYK